MTPATPLFTQFHIICLVPLTILLRAKFDVSSFTRSGDMEGVKNLKSRSRDSENAFLTQFYIFCLIPLRIVLRAKFGVSSFTHSGNMEKVPKFKK